MHAWSQVPSGTSKTEQIMNASMWLHQFSWYAYGKCISARSDLFVYKLDGLGTIVISVIHAKQLGNSIAMVHAPLGAPIAILPYILEYRSYARVMVENSINMQ